MSGEVDQSLSSSESTGQESVDEPAEADDDNPLCEGELAVGGPPGDRTQDTVIKSHVLYH
jgi:hypothetical protein